MTRPEVEALVRALSDDHAADGWSVTCQEFSSEFRVVVDHLLIGDSIMGMAADRDVADLERLVRSVIKQRAHDFELVRRRPVELHHPDLMRVVRQTAANAKWDKYDIEHALNLLLFAGALTDDEAEWVKDAGPTDGELPADSAKLFLGYGDSGLRTTYHEPGELPDPPEQPRT